CDARSARRATLPEGPPARARTPCRRGRKNCVAPSPAQTLPAQRLPRAWHGARSGHAGAWHAVCKSSCGARRRGTPAPRSQEQDMTIVCGTDFSDMAAHAATAAACLAVRTGGPLHLVHALDLWLEELSARPGHPLLLWAEGQLEREASRLRELGADVRVHAVAGPVDEVLQTLAREQSARAIVVGAVGHPGNSSRKLGSRADRTAQSARVPVVTVRDSAPFVDWLKGVRALRVVLGVDDSQSVENAARWLDELCRNGAVELTLAHLYWPPEALHRFGLEDSRSFVEPDPELVKTLEQQF